MNYLPKRYELQLSVFQIAVLLLFNDNTSYSFSDIQQQTQLSESELLRVLRVHFSFIKKKRLLFSFFKKHNQ